MPADPKIIDGEVVAAPRVLAAEPAKRVHLRCDTHPEWLDCGLDRPDCVGYMASVDPTDYHTSDSVTVRIRDRRRLSYPRLLPGELDAG